MAKKKAEPKKPGKAKKTGKLKPRESANVGFSEPIWEHCWQAVVFAIHRYRALKHGPTPMVRRTAKAHIARLRELKQLLDRRESGKEIMDLPRGAIKLLREAVCEAVNWCEALPGYPRQESFSGTRGRLLQNDVVFDAIWVGKDDLKYILGSLHVALLVCYEQPGDTNHIVPPHQTECLKSEIWPQPVTPTTSTKNRRSS